MAVGLISGAKSDPVAPQAFEWRGLRPANLDKREHLWQSPSIPLPYIAVRARPLINRLFAS